MRRYSKRFERFLYQYEWLIDAPDWACRVFLRTQDHKWWGE